MVVIWGAFTGSGETGEGSRGPAGADVRRGHREVSAGGGIGQKEPVCLV